jgi:hypothetical protein
LQWEAHVTQGACKLFISQEALDRWISESRASIDGDELTDQSASRRFRLVSAVRFLSEVSGQPDGPALVGKVKDVDQLAVLKAEHMRDSVILGDNAYLVQEGFVGTLVVADARAEPAKPRARAATIASLQAFFLNNVK